MTAARLAIALALAAAVAATPAAAAPAPPDGWPMRLAIGVTDGPGGAAKLGRLPGISMRYQYLAGGVDTGNGWSTWNEDGTFVSRYVAESRSAGLVPVLTYYMLLQSRPGRGGGEAEKDLANLRDAELMRRYLADFVLALQRASAGAVIHVEPDLWGYVQQQGGGRGDPARTPAAVGMEGLPDTVSGFAQALVRLRDRHAPKVLLAWHLSSWGTNRSHTAGDLPAAQIDAMADSSAAFYRSLGARFDLVFNDVADRDDGFRQKVLKERPVTHHWGRGDVARHLRWVRGVTRATKTKMVLWQLPLGHRRLPNTPRRYRDNRVDLLLGSRRNLRRARDAGIVALMFGAGADGCTTARTDGGHFFRLARRYARRPLTL